MCGRYAIFADPDDLAERFDVAVDGYEPTYNAAPSQELPVILGERSATLSEARWGLVPSWSDGPSGDDPINARAETLTEKPSFRDAYRERRCLVPVNGFYEWVETADGKRPYYVSRADEEPFALAGIWAEWTPEQKQTGLGEFGGNDGPDRTTEPVRSFTIVTTAPNDFLSQYHHRMAVILPEAGERRWLEADDPDDLLEPAAVDLQAWPVSTAVNSPANDRPELTEPIDAAT